MREKPRRLCFRRMTARKPSEPPGCESTVPGAPMHQKKRLQPLPLPRKPGLGSYRCFYKARPPHHACQAMQETLIEPYNALYNVSMRCSSAACLLSQKQATAAAREQPIGRLRADDLICMRVVAGLGMASAVAAWSEGSTRPRQWVCVPTHPRSVPKV